MQLVSGMIAGVFAFVGYVVYGRAILKGPTRPNRMTWFIIAIESWVLLLTYGHSGANTTIWVPASEAFAASVIAVLCIKRGVGGADKVDIICFFGATLSLVLWWYFDSSVVGLISGLMVDTFALWPTIKKSLKKPSQEDRPAWTLTQIANSFNLLAIDQFTFGVLLYPVWRFLLDGIVIYALYRKKRK